MLYSFRRRQVFYVYTVIYMGVGRGEDNHGIIESKQGRAGLVLDKQLF